MTLLLGIEGRDSLHFLREKDDAFQAISFRSQGFLPSSTDCMRATHRAESVGVIKQSVVALGMQRSPKSHVTTTD